MKVFINYSIEINFICLQEVSICTLGPDFDHDGKVDVAKYMKITFGKVSLSKEMFAPLSS